MIFRNISKKEIRVPYAVLKNGDTYFRQFGGKEIAVPPGEEFDVVMGYAVPKRSQGGLRMPSVLEKRVGPNKVEPSDPALRPLWHKAPERDWYEGMRNDPWRGQATQKREAPAPVIRNGRVMSADEAVPASPQKKAK